MKVYMVLERAFHPDTGSLLHTLPAKLFMTEDGAVAWAERETEMARREVSRSVTYNDYQYVVESWEVDKR